MMQQRSRQTFFAFIAALLLALSALGVQAQTTTAPVRTLPDFAALAEQQGQVVVNISTTQIVKSRSSAQGFPFPFDDDDPMADFFRRFIPRGQQPSEPRESESHSLGSGFIISSDGYILTNAHVVDAADEVVVRLTDRREFNARVVGADRRTDVAVIKIEATGLPVAKLGNPEKLRVGEWVAAIGSPFGFENSVTAGIVSAKGRSLPQENYVPFIQTDVAVNPGNSGGPLFNLNGEVVGINSQIYSRSGGFMGLSFAIPIDVAIDVQNQLRATGKVSRGRMGVVIQEVTRELAESFGLAKAEGAVVSSVEKDGAAAQAGIEAGDVVLRFDGKTVSRSADLPRLVAATRPGSKVKVQVWRKGAPLELSLTVGELKEETASVQPRPKSAHKPEREATRLGLAVSELTAEQRQKLGVTGGLLIEDIRSNAVRADLRVGDIILALINKGVTSEVRTLEQFNKLLAPFSKNANVTLLVRRDDQQVFITIKGLGD
jgi:serine protease Do